MYLKLTRENIDQAICYSYVLCCALMNKDNSRDCKNLTYSILLSMQFNTNSHTHTHTQKYL